MLPADIDRPSGPAPVFAALGDPTRLSLLAALSAGQERSIAGLAGEARRAAGISLSRQAVAKHLAVLQKAGLVASRKVGRESRFRARPVSCSCPHLPCVLARRVEPRCCVGCVRCEFRFTFIRHRSESRRYGGHHRFVACYLLAVLTVA